jgi:hypothetical protein
MKELFLSRLESAALMAWVVGTSALLLGATASSLRNPSLPVHFGWIHAQGPAAVWATLLPGLCGLAAAVALLQKRAGAAILLLGYSVYWLVILGGGLAEAAFHTTNRAVAQLPWWTWVTGGALFLTSMGAFLLMALWSIERLREWSAGQLGS